MARKLAGVNKIDGRIEGVSPEDLDKMLGKINVIFRGETLENALKAASQPVVKAYRKEVPKPGYKGDKKKHRSLRSSISYKKKVYKGNIWVGIVGARVNTPWSAHHAHLFEDGHRMVVSRGPRAGEDIGFVQGRRAMAKVVDQTRAESGREFMNAIEKAIQRAEKHAL